MGISVKPVKIYRYIFTGLTDIPNQLNRNYCLTLSKVVNAN